ncbi:transcriptional regulator [Streptomyces sp. NBC_00724]|uniref:transcriptional regulator n=1 Tax=Streptomyces sp. NBC_00724 TaxID=2975812 RepID=UPI002ED426BD|nr:transcriptional regulator [Streptomyces sp. NBC_00724]
MPATSPRPRHLLAAVRTAFGYTLAGYAKALEQQAPAIGYGAIAWRREKISRWEAGATEPELPAQLVMADLHGVDPDQVAARGWPDWLLLALPGPDIWAPFALEATLSALDYLAADPSRADDAGTPLVPPDVLHDLTVRWTAHIQHTIERGIGGAYIGVEVSTAIQARLTALWHLDDSLGGTPCTTSARADLRMVTRLLRHARHTGQLTTDLHYLAAEYARFLGWAEFDADNQPGAQRAWHAALRASAEVADPAHSAYLLSNLALTAIYDDDAHQGTELLATARDIAGSRTTPLVAAMIDTWRVRAAAAEGDAAGAARFLMTAEKEFDHAQQGDENPPWAYWMCRPSHMAETGRAFLDLGEPATAETLLTEGLQALPKGATRDRILYLTWIATAQARQQSLDAAADTASTALDLAPLVDSGRCSNLLDDLSRELSPHSKSSQVASVLERLRSA